MTSDTKQANETLSKKWSRVIGGTREPILQVLRVISHTSARNPKRTVLAIPCLSIAVLILGFATNFHIHVDEQTLWAPTDSKSVAHMNWIDDDSGFPAAPRFTQLFFHQESGNVLGQDQVRRVFEAVDSIRGLEGYNKSCASGDDDNSGCKISGIINFWNQSATVFEKETSSDEDTIVTLSKRTFPDGTPVAEENVYGFPVRNPNTDILTSAQAFSMYIQMPDTDISHSFEAEALDTILALDDVWKKSDDTSLRVDCYAFRSFSDEFERGIVKDIPLVPLAFIIMSLFTCTVLSSKVLGFCAVVAVVLSLMTGYGTLFLASIPFTSMTQILPFVIFGIGLDDAFILSGSYSRTDTSKDPVERISDVIDDVGVSITLTTLTSTIAFGLGCISSVPAIYWLCLYAFPTIIIVFFYQLTFFVACIVLDERRNKDRRLCGCGASASGTNEESTQDRPAETEPREPIADRFMGWYSKQLLRPVVKPVVLVFFAAVLGACAYSATKLQQEFKFTDVLPSDSYVTDFFHAHTDFSSRSVTAALVYFRDVDQSDPSIQDQMEQYVTELVETDAIEEEPEFFWLRDFKKFVNDNPGLEKQSFNGQILAFLWDPVFSQLYGDDIVLDQSGYIVTSRVKVYLDNVDLEDINDQIDTLEDIQAVSRAQPVNAGKSDWSFFTYDDINYNVWEFYAATTDELILTTILGVVAVTWVALFFIPHWTAALFVMPLISVLYVDLLGFMQWMGASINPVAYVSLVMSIGLLVDFIVHVLLKYYESSGRNRHEKTIDMLQTMGASVLLGGISTSLGMLPLALSSSEIFRTVFIAFFGLVVMGVSHGLILLPVVLSMIGPEDSIALEDEAPSEAPIQSEKASQISATPRRIVTAPTDTISLDGEQPEPSSLRTDPTWEDVRLNP